MTPSQENVNSFANNGAAQFIDAIRASGITPPDLVIADGVLHRFSSNGAPHDDAGWYVLYDGEFPAGAFGDWRTGVSINWHADVGRQLAPTELAEQRERIAAARVARENDKKQRQADAAARATRIWESAKPAVDHPYLTKKGISAYGARIHQECLVNPVRNVNGELTSLQFIDAGGQKRFLSGGITKGGFSLIGGPSETLLLCEGYATAASLHLATGHTVAMAFSASNLETVAVSLRGRYPKIRIIVCADDDQTVGISKARKAAQSIGSRVAVPDFGDNRPEGATDFNDLHSALGLDAVRRCIDRLIDSPTGNMDSTPARPAAKFVPEIITARQLCEMEFPPVRWAVDGILPSGTTLFAGPPKEGKTRLALNIALGIAGGGMVLGHIPVEQGSVLYICLDDPKRRLQEIIRAGGLIAPDNLMLAFHWARFGEGGEDAINDFLAKTPDCRFVCLDVLKHFRPSAQSPDFYREDFAIGDLLRPIAVAHNTTIMANHHTNKQIYKLEQGDDPVQTIAGTTGLTGGFDNLLVLYRQRGSADAFLHITGNDVVTEDKALVWDTTLNTWRLAGETVDTSLADDFKGGDRWLEIRKLLQQHGALTVTELAALLYPGKETKKGTPEFNRTNNQIHVAKQHGRVRQRLDDRRYVLSDIDININLSNPSNPTNPRNPSNPTNPHKENGLVCGSPPLILDDDTSPCLNKDSTERIRRIRRISNPPPPIEQPTTNPCKKNGLVDSAVSKTCALCLGYDKTRKWCGPLDRSVTRPDLSPCLGSLFSREAME